MTNSLAGPIHSDFRHRAAEPLFVALPGRQARATFKVRLNRFAALVTYKDKDIKVHVPNSGRLQELLLPGTPVLLTPREGEHRKTAFDLSFAPTPSGQGWVCIDSRVPNLLVAAASRTEENPLYPGYYLLQREPSLGESRLDFLFDALDGPMYVEAKCVTLVTEGNIARFPDAPTERGQRHLRELTRLVQGGGRGGVLFLVQRSDAIAFSPHDAMDPSFGEGLRRAGAAGVQVRAWTCLVNPGRVFLKSEIPVLL